MSYFSYLFKIQDLSERRILQLKLEEKMDSALYNTYKECPEITLKFLLQIRKINRINSYEIYNSSIVKYPEAITKNLDLTEYFYNKYNLLNPTCDNINTFINK
jgi:hypothetical protein